MSKADELQNIFKKGYGTISKSVMTDTSISLESKAIFAYFCALAGSGNKTFPFRSTIIKQLGLSKNTYYKYYNELIQKGLISVKASCVRFSNTYIINSNQKEIKGYGIISREIMQDTRLSVKSKGLYAYICSLCGKKNHAFPSKKQILKHLNISEPTYYICLNQLKECGYVFTKQRLSLGRFSINDYYLYSLPNETAPDDMACSGKQRRGLPEEHRRSRSSVTSSVNNEKPNTNICDIPLTNICDASDTRICDTYLITALSNNNISINGFDGTVNEPFDRFAINIINKFFPETQHSKIINDFLPRFRENIKGKGDIFNLSAYIKASINSFLAESSIKSSMTTYRASYDLNEIESLVFSGARKPPCPARKGRGK